jgi:D-tyrosyl-tRNA(Tyr) deacylase
LIALIQRVAEAKVAVGGGSIGSIGRGILAFIGVERGDGENEAVRLAERVLTYRIFSDAAGKMNLSLLDIEGGLLVVPQFTLAADTRSGTRPSFSSAGAPAEAEALFKVFMKFIGERHTAGAIASGSFGADMKVSLVNDGPVTFWLQVSKKPA